MKDGEDWWPWSWHTFGVSSNRADAPHDVLHLYKCCAGLSQQCACGHSEPVALGGQDDLSVQLAVHVLRESVLRLRWSGEELVVVTGVCV